MEASGHLAKAVQALQEAKETALRDRVSGLAADVSTALHQTANG